MSSLEETRGEFNLRSEAIKLGIDVHQEYYVVVEQIEGGNPKPAQRLPKATFLGWATKLRRKHPGAAARTAAKLSRERTRTIAANKCLARAE